MKLFKENIYPLLILAIPLALTGLVESSSFFFETMFLARLGHDVLAAGALVSWLFGTFNIILFGILSSINILVSHKHGAKDVKGISLVVRDGIWLAFLLTIPTFVLFWNISPIFHLLGLSPEIIELSETYLRALTWALLPDFLMIVLLEFIVGLGHARLILIFSTLSVISTIFFSFALIFGKFGFPELGIAGAGWGTTISYWLSAICLATYVIINKEYRVYLHYLFTPTQQSYVIELFKIGIPMGIMYCVEVGFFFALTLVMGVLGSQQLAANQIALQYMCMLMSIAFSFAQAITVRMGHLLGGGNKAPAEHASYVGICLSAGLMVIMAFIYWGVPNFLISIDFDIHNAKNTELIHIATQFLAVSALFQIFEAMRIALFGALRALKDTRFTLFISIISFWGIAFPIGYVLTYQTNLGAVGLWWGMVIGAGFSLLLLFWRFRFKMNSYCK